MPADPDGIGRLGSDLENCLGSHDGSGESLYWPLSGFLWGCRTPEPNACAMSHRFLSFDPSASAAIPASVTRMGNDENRSNGPSGPTTSVITKVKPKTKRPNLYRVLILNDDETPMEFVVHVLEVFFDMDTDTAIKIMYLIHNQGAAKCGYYSYDLAKKKTAEVMAFAREHSHPLQCCFEKSTSGT